MDHSGRERPDPGSTSPLGCEDLKRDACTSLPPKSMDKDLWSIYTSEAQSTSPCPKTRSIILYSGVVGSENLDDIDIPEKDFISLTVLCTVLPPNTPTANHPTIPGYTGKALHDRPYTLATSQPSSMPTHQTTGSSSTPSSYVRQGPLSPLVITVQSFPST